MDKRLKERVGTVVKYLEEATNEENEKKIWDKAIDVLELLVEQSNTKLDDFFLKPIFSIIRRRLDIPDDIS